MGHPPSKLGPGIGIRTYNATTEQEAFSGGGALAMPYGQLLRLAEAGKPLQTIADTFGVSAQMARCRVNRTGLSRMYRKWVAS